MNHLRCRILRNTHRPPSYNAAANFAKSIAEDTKLKQLGYDEGWGGVPLYHYDDKGKAIGGPAFLKDAAGAARLLHAADEMLPYPNIIGPLIRADLFADYLWYWYDSADSPVAVSRLEFAERLRGDYTRVFIGEVLYLGRPKPPMSETERVQARQRNAAAFTAALELLRNAGFVVVAWTPEELGDVHRRHFEDRLTETGNEYLAANCGEAEEDPGFFTVEEVL